MFVCHPATTQFLQAVLPIAKTVHFYDIDRIFCLRNIGWDCSASREEFWKTAENIL